MLVSSVGKTSIMSALLITMGLAGASYAGGYTAPTDLETVVLGDRQDDDDEKWKGMYAGASAGYAFGGDDRFGISEQPGEHFSHDIGKFELGGANGGVRMGYRWQRGRFVFGPEVGVEFGGINDKLSGLVYDTNTGNGDHESKLKHAIALRFKTGYAVRDDVLFYGIAGVIRGKFNYNGSEEYSGETSGRASYDVDYNRTGYVVGLGVEKMINDRLSVTGEWEYANYGKEHLMIFDDISTEATPDYHNVKLGVNFKF